MKKKNKTKKEKTIMIRVPVSIKELAQKHTVGTETEGSALKRILKEKKVLK